MQLLHAVASYPVTHTVDHELQQVKAIISIIPIATYSYCNYGMNLYSYSYIAMCVILKAS